MSKNHNTEQGAALIIVLMVMIVAVILGTIILQISLAETKFSVLDKNRIEAVYIARAGVEATASWLVDPSNDPTTLLNKESVSQNFGTGTYKVSVIGEGSSSEIIVKGTGVVNGASQTVSMIVNKVHLDGYAFDKAVFADENISVSGSAVINGPVGSNGSITVPEKNQGLGYNDDDYMEVVFPSPVFPSDPTGAVDAIYNNGGAINFTTEGQVITKKNLQLKNSKTLTIDTSVGNKPLHLVLNSIDSQGIIKVIGSNRLYIYVKHLAFFSDTNAWKVSGNEYAFGDPANLLILLGDGATMTLNGNSALSGFVYGPKATVSLLNGTVTVGGGFNVRIFNSNGNFTINDDPDARESIDLNELPVNAYVRGNWIK